MTTSIWWVRRDLRLDDNPALSTAFEDGTVVPVYIHAPEDEAPWAPGAASQSYPRGERQPHGAIVRPEPGLGD